MVGIVTGGSKGIGLAIARAFLARGMQVTISARKETELEEAARRLGPSTPLGAGGGDNVLTVRADVRDAGDAQRLGDATVKRFGGVHVPLHNARMRSVPHHPPTRHCTA